MRYEDRVDKFAREVERGEGTPVEAWILLVEGAAIAFMCLIALLFFGGCAISILML